MIVRGKKSKNVRIYRDSRSHLCPVVCGISWRGDPSDENKGTD